MPIRVLSEQLASQIAAGEVVERPASAVKELVENALDAGAATVHVDIRGGGRQLIQIADDGNGIAAAEVETAFLRHATSKLDSIEMLNRIRTLGFRGEALAAIAAVSRVTLVTRAAGETAGTRLVLDGGHLVSRYTVGAPQGTVIAVENLFYNTPARLKFLKSTVTEKRYIDEFITRYALAYPDVRWRLGHDGRITFQSAGSGSRRDVLAAVYGVDLAREFLRLDAGDGPDDDGEDDAGAARSQRADIAVTGFVSPPGLHRANRSHITLFVNGRWVKDTRLTYAIIQAYHTLLPTGRYPLATVFVTLPPEEVDVNVHPTKTEVRFRRPNLVFSAVQRTVRATLVGHSPIRPASHFTSVTADWTGTLGSQRPRPTAPWADHDHQPTLDLPRPAAPDFVVGQADSAESLPNPAPVHVGGGQLPIMRVIGQVGAAFIITEGPDGMFLIDQHAAHERILYEQFMAARARAAVPSQGLVAGAVVQLPPDQATLLEDQLDVLARLGFTVEPFGPNTFMVRAVPAMLVRRDPAQALTEVVEELAQEKAPLADEIERRVILRVCKTAAVKAGQTLSAAEIEALVRQLEACQSPHTCPHGRPTLIHLSVAQLAREFGRI